MKQYNQLIDAAAQRWPIEIWGIGRGYLTCWLPGRVQVERNGQRAWLPHEYVVIPEGCWPTSRPSVQEEVTRALDEGATLTGAPQHGRANGRDGNGGGDESGDV